MAKAGAEVIAMGTDGESRLEEKFALLEKEDQIERLLQKMKNRKLLTAGS